MKTLALKPRISEKAYALSENSNTYVFDVDKDVNRFDVARAVEDQYQVTVTKVRSVTVPGKSKRTYRQRGRKQYDGQRSDIRKAYVTLKEGDSLPIFAGMDENPAKPEKEPK